MKEIFTKRFQQRHKVVKSSNGDPLRLNAFVAIFLLIFAFNSISSTALSQSDSLYKYLEIAAQNNPAILQKFNEYQAALEKVPQVGGLSDPELSMGVFLTPMELIDGKQVADFRLMQMFPWFGVLRNAKDEMSLMANARFELMRDTKLQVFYDVQRTWFELFRIQKEINISEKNIEILDIIERLALVKYKSASSAGSGTGTPGSTGSATTSSSGMQSMNPGQTGQTASQSTSSMQSGSTMSSSSGSSGLADVYSIQIEAGEIENKIELLKSQQKTTMARFNSYLNRPMSAPVFVTDSLPMDSLEFSLSELSDSLLAKNPMLGMLNYEKQSYEARKKMVSRMGFPMLGFGLNYSLINKSEVPMGEPEMNGKDMLMPMVAVTLPIYRKKYNAMKKEAELLAESTSQNYQGTSNLLQTEYYQAIQLYQDAQRRVKLYEKQYQLASKTLDLTLKSFSTSSAGLADVLRVRQQTLDYELRQVEAVVDFNTAAAWLKRLMAFSQIQ